MSHKINRSSLKLSMQLLMVIAAALLIWGCGGGGSSYDAPVATQTATPLIDAATLNGWQGLVNSDGFDNVVILQVGSEAKYDVEHIPGAYYWAVSQAGRLEGLAFDKKSMVPEGALMDAMIQRTGIDGDTTIVITFASDDNFYYAARAYFTLRYWGFPKERIKVLNGGNNAWDDSYALTATVPAERASDYSVADNAELRDDLRYSIGEMIQAVDANTASVAATGDLTYNIVQQAAAAPLLISNAIGRPFTAFAVGGVTPGGYFVTAAEAEAVLLDTADTYGPGNYVEGLPTVVHCVSGFSASPSFFVMDALLGWDVALYDGSKSQWDTYRGDDGGGDARINDAWNVNANGRSEDTTIVDLDVNANTVLDIDEDINAFLNFSFPTNDAAGSSQIEEADLQYMDAYDDGAAAPSAGGGDAGGGC